MKRTVLLLITSILCLVANAQRTQMSDAERTQRRAERIGQQTERMVKELKLNDDVRSQFAALYTKYQEELYEVSATEQQRNRDAEKGVEDMSDEECYQKIADYLAQQEKQIEQSKKRLEITKKYMAEMLPLLNAKQMYRVFGQRQVNAWRQPQGGNAGQRGSYGGGAGGQRGFGGQGGYGGQGGFGGNGGF